MPFREEQQLFEVTGASVSYVLAALRARWTSPDYTFFLRGNHVWLGSHTKIGQALVDQMIAEGRSS